MSRAALIALLLAVAAGSPAAAAPVLNFVQCTPGMEQRSYCVAGDVVELRAWSAEEWQAVRLPELALAIGYEPTVACAAERVVDRSAGGLLLIAGVGDGTCTAERLGESIPNPQPAADAVRRALHAREVLADYQRRVEAAQKAARETVPFPEPTDLEPRGAAAGGSAVTPPPGPR
jgi:hypothetical protein